jgi:hypothetical protein
MTISTNPIFTNGQDWPAPTISPVKCTPWCTDGDGHTGATSREDQSCWGREPYVELSLEEVEVNVGKEPGEYEIWPSAIGPCAYRGFSQLPAVYLHFTLQRHNDGGLLDDSCKLTVDEARALAVALLAVADEIDGAK